MDDSLTVAAYSFFFLEDIMLSAFKNNILRPWTIDRALKALDYSYREMSANCKYAYVSYLNSEIAISEKFASKVVLEFFR